MRPAPDEPGSSTPDAGLLDSGLRVQAAVSKLRESGCLLPVFEIVTGADAF